ncbi:uncharacterized protein LOC143677521 [Tamandua tetradactyla]|uniref:uncharacterized protein LOC143677521 n=1 Tax=Tamandua tetradactyla TaxID=48850 RepID=UPI00405439AD
MAGPAGLPLALGTASVAALRDATSLPARARSAQEKMLEGHRGTKDSLCLSGSSGLGHHARPWVGPPGGHQESPKRHLTAWGREAMGPPARTSPRRRSEPERCRLFLPLLGTRLKGRARKASACASMPPACHPQPRKWDPTTAGSREAGPGGPA